MTGTIVLAIPRTPRSFNAVGARGGYRAFHKEKRAWEDELALTLMVEGLPQVPQLSHVTASAVLRFKSNRTRDEGNFRVLLEKALGDALRGHPPTAWPQGRWLPDDDPAHYTFRGVTFSPDLGPARTLLTLEWRQADALG